MRLLGLALVFFLNQAFGSLALEGYDPVTYFQKSGPQKGSSQYTWAYGGKDWQFIDAQNRKTFQTNPQKYAPQYEGHCAWVVAKGRLTPGDPQYWTVTNGKLYLLCNQEVLDKWKRNLPENIRRADREWIQLRPK